MMDNTQLQQTIGRLIPRAVFNQNTQFVEVVIPADGLHQTAQLLKENPETKFDFLFNLTGVDSKNELRMVYHLRSTLLKHTLVVKVVTTDRQNPEFASVSDIWPAANPFEREAYDLLGIRFTNHPDLRRLFLEEDWVGYPLRKDYKDSFTLER